MTVYYQVGVSMSGAQETEVVAFDDPPDGAELTSAIDTHVGNHVSTWAVECDAQGRTL